MPSIRHPGYGVHIRLTLDLPKGVAHIAGAFGRGRALQRSLEATMMRWADHCFWMIIEQGACYPMRTLAAAVKVA